MLEPIEALQKASEQHGIDASSPTLVRAGENHIYRLTGGVIGRIARRGQAVSTEREIAVARWLEDVGIRAVRPLPVEQPVVMDGLGVTFWHELGPHRNGSVREIAGLLKRLHSVPVPEHLREIQLSPFVRLPERIEQATTISEDDRTWLTNHLAELRERWESRPAGLPDRMVHGDAWSGNIVYVEGEGVTLLDLERFSVGPPEWDLTSTAIGYTTFGTRSSTDYDTYCAEYGMDVTQWEGYALFRDIREMRSTCNAIQRSGPEPQWRHEATHRLRCLQGLEGSRPWSWVPVT